MSGMKNIKFTYSKCRIDRGGEEDLIQVKNLKSTVIKSEELLQQKIHYARRSADAYFPSKLRDISNLPIKRVHKIHLEPLMPMQEELPSICSSPCFPGVQITRKILQKPYQRQALAVLDKQNEVHNFPKTLMNEGKGNGQLESAKKTIKKGREKNIDIVIRPEDISGKGVIWVKRS